MTTNNLAQNNTCRDKGFTGPLIGSGLQARNRRFQPDDDRGPIGLDNTVAIRMDDVVRDLSHSAVVEERNRMAREIHDTLAQEFAGILLHLQAANTADGNISECLARAMELAKCGLEDARRMLFGLRPKPLEGANLPDALAQLAKRFSRDCGIHCTFHVSGPAYKLPEENENELYRVAQEALCNARKHSRASSVSMILGYESSEVVLAIRDNGRGFAKTQHRAGAYGFGLLTMCDRAHRLGGTMNINSAPGAGAELRMTVPVSGKISTEKD